MSSANPSDTVLIREHLRGNPTALLQLWMRYDGLVYGIAHSITCRRDVAEDIRQEVFLKVHGELPQLQSPAKFTSWLRSITYNACRTWLRRQRPVVPLDSLTDAQHPRSTIGDEDEERRTLLRRMIDLLPQEQREVIELHYFEGSPVAQIARFLGLPESTVKWRIHKARVALRTRAKLGDCGL